MAWLAKNALGGLFLPPCNLLLVQLAGLALWRKKPRLSRALVVASCAGLAFCSMPATAVILVEAVEGDVVPLHLEDPGLVSQADAIVVLGGGRIVHSQEYGGQDAISAYIFSTASLNTPTATGQTPTFEVAWISL